MTTKLYFKTVDGRYISLDNNVKDMQKARVTKYIKRVPKPSGKGYYYFYTKQQFKDYKEKGIVPKEEGKSSVWDKLKSFFGGNAEEPVSKLHDTVTKQGISITKDSLAEHLAEYIANKAKWDARFSGEKKEKGESKPKSEAPKSEKKEPSEKKESKWNTDVMKFFSNQFGMIGALKQKDVLKEAEERSAKQADEFVNRKNFIDKKLKEKFGEKSEYIPEMESRYSADRKKVIEDAKKEFENKSDSEKFKEAAKESPDNFDTMPEGDGKPTVQDIKDGMQVVNNKTGKAITINLGKTDSGEYRVQFNSSMVGLEPTYEKAQKKAIEYMLENGLVLYAKDKNKSPFQKPSATEAKEIERTERFPDVPTYAEVPEGFKKVEGTNAPKGYEFYRNGSPLSKDYKQVLVKDKSKVETEILKNFTIVDNDNPSRTVKIKAKDLNEAKSKGASELKTTNIRTYESSSKVEALKEELGKKKGDGTKKEDYSISETDGMFQVKGKYPDGKDFIANFGSKDRAEKGIENYIERNKDMIKLGFNKIDDYIDYKNKISRDKDKKIQEEKESLKQQAKDKTLNFIESDNINKNYIQSLDSKNKALLINELEKQNYRLPNGKIGTVMDIVNSGDFQSVRKTEVPKIKYDRVKYNRMDAKQQKIYEEKLKEKKMEYLLELKNGSSYEIPKKIYDVLNQSSEKKPDTKPDFSKDESQKEGSAQEKYDQAKKEIKQFEDEEKRSGYSESEWNDYLKELQNEFDQDLKTYKDDKKNKTQFAHYYDDAVKGLKRIKEYQDSVKNLSKLKEDAMDESGQGKMFKAISNLREELMIKAATTKYIKRIPNPKGKGYIYFYTPEQVKAYEKDGTLPEEKKEKVPQKEGKSKIEILKETTKKVASIFADALSARDTVQPTGQAVEQTGENIKDKAKEKKRLEEKKASDKNKSDKKSEVKPNK